MHQPHDKLYREFFNHPQLIEELLRGFVDEQFVHDLDFSSLTKLNPTFTTDEFIKREADIVYEILYKEKPIYIYLLLELQSSVDQFMVERMLQYVCAFSREYCKTRKVIQFPPVFPLVLYNGNRKWDAAVQFQKLVSSSPLPSKYIPHFGYALVAINEIPKRKLFKLHNTLSALFYIESSKREEIDKHIGSLIDFIHNDLPAIYPKFLTWFFRVQEIELSPEQMKQVRSKSEVQKMLRTTILEACYIYERVLIKKSCTLLLK
jgi:predicted transposase/invertase (TIGR01784 family)